MGSDIAFVIKIFGLTVVSAVGAVVFGVLQHKKKYPEKSYVIALLNTVLTPFRLLKIGPFKDGMITIEQAMQIASKETGLTDFGNLDFVTTYKKISSTQYFKSLSYTNLGFIMANMEWNINLKRRLKLVNFIKSHPEIRQIPLREPLFIFGLGRSGTTFVHRLLSLDPQARSPALWELIHPAPEVDIKSYNKDAYDKDRAARLEFIKDRLKQRHVMGDDGLEKFHEVGAELPEECLFALSDEIPTIFHYIFTDLYKWEHFTSVVGPEDVTRAFAWYKQLLQVLLYQTNEVAGEKRWVLKCPLHTMYTKEIAKVFPNAKLVWAHRHPVPTVTSLCALLRAMHGVYYHKETCDEAKLGQAFKGLASKYLIQARKDIESSGLNCAHVLFENLTVDPIATVKQVYSQFNWEFTPEYEKILVDYLEVNRKQREEIKAKHSKGKKTDTSKIVDYKPEDFHLTAKELSEGPFADYIAAFNITKNK